jgi:hypothetical protein
LKKQFIFLLLVTPFIFGCKTDTKKQDEISQTREDKIVNLTFTLETEDLNEKYTLKSRQDIIHTFGRSSLELDRVEPPYIETIAGLKVHEGFKVKLEFKDATRCNEENECKYLAKLYISVDGEVVASGNFNCMGGEGSGEIEYTFD